MHYRIQLPVDYDMAVIRRRVAERGHILDDYPGLAFKAYLIRENLVHGDNAYAPFYVWRGVDAMSSFLTGPGFGQLCADFGRPVVKAWWVSQFSRSASSHQTPREARLATRVMAPAKPISVAVGAEVALLDAREGEGRHSALVAFELRESELIRFELWEEQVPPLSGGEAFTCLHLSAPSLAVG